MKARELKKRNEIKYYAYRSGGSVSFIIAISKMNGYFGVGKVIETNTKTFQVGYSSNAWSINTPSFQLLKNYTSPK
jgi:hypothetical protein